MEKQTENKNAYVKAWCSHIDSLFLLGFTPSREIREDVIKTLEHLKELVVKVADDKGLK